jgi:hypothetical protein
MPVRPSPTKEVYEQRAAALAKLAHEQHFESRGGLWPVRDLNCVCYFNNNPYEKDAELRGRRVAQLRDVLSDDLLAAELAYVEYPTEGDEAGYSFAMLIGAPPSDVNEVRFWVEQCELPLGVGGIPSHPEREKTHVQIGGIPFVAEVVIEGLPGLPAGIGLALLNESVGDPMAATAEFEPDPARRYFPAGSQVFVKWLDEPHPSTGLRQCEIVANPHLEPQSSDGE